ncbi:MAG TPA: cobalamin-independent methionine synthase II family protein [Xanthobacteraceae bacterium]|nr:cobalamin-independent methionine synthase II family protein [Xanthobacteraceae bacterium]
MKRSVNRILTTHVGSLIRPPELLEFYRAKQNGLPYSELEFEKCLRDSVAAVVKKQAEVGIDVVSDGEFGKSISWSQYVLERLSGFERRPFSGANPFARGADRSKFPEFYAELDARDKIETTMDSVAVAPIRYTGQALLKRDIDNFKAALRKVKVVEAFLPVAAPASVIPDRKNEYYKSDDALLAAIGKAMRTEYKMIIDAGLLLQLDDARTAVTYDRMVPPASKKDYLKWVARHVEILNDAIKGLPRDRIRYHVCWGSWPGPHVTDIPLKDIVDLILKLKVGAFVIEGANPRHEHEWRVWEKARLPDGAILIPGVISHATNIVEHPELVAERIVRLANLVGRENVIASTDCGFAQGPFHRRVHPTIMWAKLSSLVEGARLATRQLWGRRAAATPSAGATRKGAGRRKAAAKTRAARSAMRKRRAA